MTSRNAVLLILLAGMSLVAGCKKSSESDAPNFFGSPPTVSELSITKQSRQFACTSDRVALCCADPPACTCCCQKDQVHQITASIDLIQMSAKVSDADGISNILVVLARFFDPPTSGATSEISLEMFDVGTDAVGTQTAGGVLYQVLSGDVLKNDAVFTRYFYMKSTTTEQPDDCIFKTDNTDFGGTYSQYLNSVTFPATKILNYSFHVEAVDRAGNVTPSGAITLPVLESQVTNTFTTQECGPQLPSGGCEPPPP